METKLTRVLILGSCTSKKKYEPTNTLTYKDFLSKSTILDKIQYLEKYKCRAIEMYEGFQHKYILEGLSGANIKIDYYILSAGFGLISLTDFIYPYKVTFKDMTDKQIEKHSKRLKIETKLNLLTEKYDVIFFAMGATYFKALKEIKTKSNQLFFVLIGENSKVNTKIFKGCGNVEIFRIPFDWSKEFHCSTISIKGLLLKLFFKLVSKNPLILNDFRQSPSFLFQKIVRKARQN